MGISWLPIIFGPYFALRLAGAGDRPSSLGKAVGFAFLGLVVFVLGGVLGSSSLPTPLQSNSARVPADACSSVYSRHRLAFVREHLARVRLGGPHPGLDCDVLRYARKWWPGWGTHYDAVPPMFAQASFAKKFFEMAVVPQLTLWLGWTVVVGSIFGGIAVALSRRGKQVAPAAV